jgi:hypothetical protein
MEMLGYFSKPGTRVGSLILPPDPQCRNNMNLDLDQLSNARDESTAQPCHHVKKHAASNSRNSAALSPNS